MHHRTVKRMGAVALASAVTLVSVACGSSGSKDAVKNVAFNQLPPCPMEALDKATKPVDITIWARAAVEQSNALDALAKEFNESQTDVRVHVRNGDSADQVYQAYKVVNGLPGADATLAGAMGREPVPALVSLNGVRMSEMADSGVVLPAQSCINATKFDNSGLAPILRAYYSIGGVQWATYMGLSVPGMGYNAEHFRRAGLDPAKAPRNFDDIERMAKQIKAKGVTDKPIALIVDPNLIEAWLTGAGASLVSNGNGRDSTAQRATFYSKAAVDLFTRLKRMYDEGLIQLSENDQDQIDHLVAMANGKASITFDLSDVDTSVQAFVDGNKKAQEQSKQLNGGEGLGNATVTTDYRTGPFPGLHTPGRVSMYGTAWFISRKAPPEQQAAAWKFAEFMYKRSSQATWLTTGGYLPVSPSTGDDASVKKFWDSGLAGRWLKVSADEVAALDADNPGPLIGPYTEFSNVMRDAIRAIRDHPELTPVQILTRAEQQFTSDLEDYSLLHQ